MRPSKPNAVEIAATLEFMKMATKDKDSVPQIYTAMAAIMADAAAIGKNRQNQQQRWMFRGIDDVYNSLHPVFAKHGVFCTTEVLERWREERATKQGSILAFTTCRIRFTFYATDGSSVCSVIDGEGMDSGDKSTNKALAIAHKYALLQALMIPTEDMADPDAETPPDVQPRRKTPPAKTGPKISDDQSTYIKDLLAESGVDQQKFFDYFQVSAVGEMTTEQYADAEKILRKRIDEKAAA